MRAFIPTAGLLLLGALSGCAGLGTADPPQPVPEDPNPFIYKSVDYPYAVKFAATSDVPSAEEMKRLQDFLRQESARPGDNVTVSTENSPLGQARSAHVRDALNRAGLDATEGVDLNVKPNTVSLVLSEMVVLPPKCGDWPVFAGDQPSNAPSLILGCVLRNNLYQMVVDKRDLAVGRTPGPADAEPGMRAVQKYREGKGDKKDSGDNSQSNSAADSATGAAEAASSLANPTSSNGNNNGQ